MAPSSAFAGTALAVAMAAGPAMAAAPAGNPDAGEAIYSRCLACHALAYDRTGPRHCGLIGRRAGVVEGFPYTDAMKKSGIVWTAATLDRFLADPMGVVPGTSMGYAGIPDAKERADLIAWLGKANDSIECKSQKTGRARAR